MGIYQRFLQLELETWSLALNPPPGSSINTRYINDRVVLNSPDMHSLRHVQTLTQGSWCWISKLFDYYHKYQHTLLSSCPEQTKMFQIVTDLMLLLFVKWIQSDTNVNIYECHSYIFSLSTMNTWDIPSHISSDGFLQLIQRNSEIY